MQWGALMYIYIYIDIYGCLIIYDSCPSYIELDDLLDAIGNLTVRDWMPYYVY